MSTVSFAQTLKMVTTTAVVTSLVWMVIGGVLLNRGSLTVPEGGMVGPVAGADAHSAIPVSAIPSPVAEMPTSSSPPLAAMPTAALVPASYAPGSDRLIIPVRGVGVNQLVDTYDDARSAGRIHNAIDIMAPTGTPVFAAAPGIVAKLFLSRMGGNTIYIRSFDQKRMYYYAHLSAYAPGLAENQRINAGQVIGAVGYSGDANPAAPHLHFAINDIAPGEGWWKGTPINPYPLLGGR